MPKTSPNAAKKLSSPTIGEIDAVVITPKRKIFDDRGAIFHMLRCDEPVFQQFGEIYFSTIYPGVVKAWHLHRNMTLNYFLVVGSVRLVLIDRRVGSPSHNTLQEIYLDESDSKLITIPPGIWNGFKGLGHTASIISNCATEAHDPDEIIRIPFNDPSLSYDWSQRHG